MRGTTLETDLDKKPVYKFPIWATASTVIVFGVMSIFGIIASENPDGLERTFEFIRDAGFTISEDESGLFGLPDGLGWAILQMAIVMIIIFCVILLVSFIIYQVRKRNYYKNHPLIQEQSTVEDEIKEEETLTDLTNSSKEIGTS